MGPGPSNAAPEVLEALGRPLIGHLDPEFLAILDEIVERSARRCSGRTNRMTFAVSGTGSAGLEAALVNVLEPGDEAIVCVNGVFGTRMADVVRARRSGGRRAVERRLGTADRAVDDVRAALEAHPDAKVFALVHAETSTGVAQPIDEIAAIVRDHGALFVLDAVTSLAGMPVDVDAWGVDVAYCRDAEVPVGPARSCRRSRSRSARSTRSRRAARPCRAGTSTSRCSRGTGASERVYHHTAPISMLTALHAGLELVLDEGLEARWERHARSGRASDRGTASSVASPTSRRRGCGCRCCTACGSRGESGRSSGAEAAARGALDRDQRRARPVQGRVLAHRADGSQRDGGERRDSSSRRSTTSCDPRRVPRTRPDGRADGPATRRCRPRRHRLEPHAQQSRRLPDVSPIHRRSRHRCRRRRSRSCPTRTPSAMSCSRRVSRRRCVRTRCSSTCRRSVYARRCVCTRRSTARRSTRRSAVGRASGDRRTDRPRRRRGSARSNERVTCSRCSATSCTAAMPGAGRR